MSVHARPTSYLRPMSDLVPAVAIGFVSTCLVAAGGIGVALAHPYGDQIVYDHALILRDGARSFASVSTGLDEELAPCLYGDAHGPVVEA